MKRARFVFAVMVFTECAAAGQAVPPFGAAGYAFPTTRVASGQVITLFVRGLSVEDAAAQGAPLPVNLNGVTVGVNTGIQSYPQSLPIFAIRSYPEECTANVQFCGVTAVTVQVPTEAACTPSAFPNDVCYGPTVITVSVQQNGATIEQVPLEISDPQPHILNTCDTILAQFGGCYPMVTHSNGHLISTAEPASPGETIVAYAVGLGETTPTVKSGAAAPSPAPAANRFVPVTLAFDLDLPPGSPPPPPLWAPTGQWITPDFAGLVPGFVGLYQINLRLPDKLPAQVHHCLDFQDVNTRILIGQGISEGQMQNVDTADICVRP
ncbi:MAG TPA: hypothetical protein VJN43_17035 [Bryobacteraceae bacterium]|nr:hypothetical protein [Bryobacteraceae bacterium]